MLLMLVVAGTAAAQSYSLIETPLRRFTLEASYGFAAPSARSSSAVAGTNFSLEATLGAKRFLDSRHSSLLVDVAYPHAIASYTGAISRPPDTTTQTTTLSLIKIGLGIKDGVGYKLEQAAVTPTLTSAWLLTVPSFGRLLASPDEQSKLERFNGLRFGVSSAAGLNIQLASSFAVDFNYEQTLVFPRVVFLQFLGAQALQMGMQIGAGYFIDAVFGGAPSLLPIAHTVLKSAINFTLYALRRDRQFFPFESESPLLVNTLKLGVAFYIGKIYE